MQKKAIYLSINPEFTQKIESGEKTYEFRKYYPKEPIERFFVYESAPTSSLKYIIDIGEVVEYPNRIYCEGYGNKEFNNGLKVSKYAYEVARLYKLTMPIPLEILKSKFGFVPPQGYAYDEKYPLLTHYLETADKDLIIGEENDLSIGHKR